MGAQVVLDDVHPVLVGVLRPLLLKVLQPGFPALVAVEPPAQPLVVNVEREVEVAHATCPRIRRGDSLGVTGAEPSRPSVRLDGDRPDLVHAQHHRWVVLFVRQPINATLLLLELRVLALLPRLDGLVAHVRLVQDHPQPLQRDGVHDPLVPRLLTETREAPLGEGEPQIAGAAGGERHQLILLFLSELPVPPSLPVGLEHLEAVEVEGVDQGADPVGGESHQPGDVGWGEPLGAGEDHLSPSELDGVSRMSADASEALPFFVAQCSDVEDHDPWELPEYLVGCC